METPAQLIDIAQALLGAPRMKGRRVAVLADGGGHGAIACDVASACGLELPLLSRELQSRIAEVLPATAATGNPVDLAGGGEQDFNSYATTVRALLESGEVDGVLMIGLLRRLRAVLRGVRRRRGRASRGTSCGRSPTPAGRWSRRRCTTTSPTSEAQREGGVPVYATIEAAAMAAAAIIEEPPPAGAPALPAG